MLSRLRIKAELTFPPTSRHTKCLASEAKQYTEPCPRDHRRCVSTPIGSSHVVQRRSWAWRPSGRRSSAMRTLSVTCTNTSAAARSSDERGRETAVSDRRQPRGAGWRTSVDDRSTLPTPIGGTPSRIPRWSASSDVEAPLGHGQADDEPAHGRLRQARRVCARNGGCGSAGMWVHFGSRSQHVRRALPPRACATARATCTAPIPAVSPGSTAPTTNGQPPRGARRL